MSLMGTHLVRLLHRLAEGLCEWTQPSRYLQLSDSVHWKAVIDSRTHIREHTARGEAMLTADPS